MGRAGIPSRCVATSPELVPSQGQQLWGDWTGRTHGSQPRTSYPWAHRGTSARSSFSPQDPRRQSWALYRRVSQPPICPARRTRHFPLLRAQAGTGRPRLVSLDSRGHVPGRTRVLRTKGARPNHGHYVYFSVRDDRDHGTFIDFVQKGATPQSRRDTQEPPGLGRAANSHTPLLPAVRSCRALKLVALSAAA